MSLQRWSPSGTSTAPKANDVSRSVHRLGEEGAGIFAKLHRKQSWVREGPTFALCTSLVHQIRSHSRRRHLIAACSNKSFRRGLYQSGEKFMKVHSEKRIIKNCFCIQREKILQRCYFRFSLHYPSQAHIDKLLQQNAIYDWCYEKQL
jgi:hypothetical protein